MFDTLLNPSATAQRAQQHDPGGKVKTAIGTTMEGFASFSDCGRYRRLLIRRWAKDGKRITFIGMNPSTADANHNDPTVKREIDFAIAWGFGEMLKVNLGDYRATSPKNLPQDPDLASTDENLDAILEACRMSDMVMAAYGVPPKPLVPMSKRIIPGIQKATDKSVYCLGLTKGGFPRHSLYCPKATVPTIFAQKS